jgi:hypothetical protein
MIGPVNRRRVAALLVPAGLLAGLLAGCTPTEPGNSGGDYSGPPPWPEIPAILPSSQPPTSPPAPAPTCPASGVRMEAGRADAAMGLRALAVELVNCGHKTYRVEGYPSVRALDKSRKPLTIRVLHGVTAIAGPLPNASGPARPVTLKPGQRASAVIVWRNTYDDTRHPPVNAPYLSIAPQPGRPAAVIAPEDALDLGSTGRLGVSPWKAG